MRTSNVYPALTRLTMATCTKESFKVPFSADFVYVIWYVALSHGFDTFFQRQSLQIRFPCEYVIARATTCPIFQCFVCLCEISLLNYKPIMHFKHSYMHNHAFYMLIHLMILLCHTYMLHFQSQFQFNSISNFQFNSLSTLNSMFMSMSMPVSLLNSQFNVYVYIYVYVSDCFQLSISLAISTFNPIQCLNQY
jgi:hypothetical protein